jgi:hypothetical protein
MWTKSPNSLARRSSSGNLARVLSTVSLSSRGLSWIDPFTTVISGASRFSQMSLCIHPIPPPVMFTGVRAKTSNPPLATRRMEHSWRIGCGGGSS